MHQWQSDLKYNSSTTVPGHYQAESIMDWKVQGGGNFARSGSQQNAHWVKAMPSADTRDTNHEARLLKRTATLSVAWAYNCCNTPQCTT